MLNYVTRCYQEQPLLNRMLSDEVNMMSHKGWVLLERKSKEEDQAW